MNPGIFIVFVAVVVVVIWVIVVAVVVVIVVVVAVVIVIVVVVAVVIVVVIVTVVVDFAVVVVDLGHCRKEGMKEIKVDERRLALTRIRTHDHLAYALPLSYNNFLSSNVVVVDIVVVNIADSSLLTPST